MSLALRRSAWCTGTRRLRNLALFNSLPGRLKLSMPKSSIVESRSCRALATVLPAKPQIPVIRTFILKQPDFIARLFKIGDNDRAASGARSSTSKRAHLRRKEVLRELGDLKSHNERDAQSVLERLEHSQ